MNLPGRPPIRRTLTWSLAAAFALCAFPSSLFAAPTISMRLDQQVDRSQTTSVLLEPITISSTSDATGSDFTAANEIRIILPNISGLEFDDSVTAITVHPSDQTTQSLTVSTTLSGASFTNSNRTVIIDVTSPSDPGDEITIFGLKVKTSSTDGIGNIGVSNDGNDTVNDSDDGHFLQIGAPKITSEDNQSFTATSSPSATTSKKITIEGASAGTVITAANPTGDIRIKIPTALTLTWDTTVTTGLTIGGTASAKVASTVAYETGGTIAVIDVDSDFAAGDTVTIEGLKFGGFTSASDTDSLELVVGGSGAASTAVDRRFKAINGPSLTGSTVSVSAGGTAAISELTVTDASTASITAANDIRISIPAYLSAMPGSGLFWDDDLTISVSGSAAGKVSTAVTQEDTISGSDRSRTIVIPVDTDFAASDTLSISGLTLKNNSGTSLTSAYLLSVNGPGSVQALLSAGSSSGGSSGGGTVRSSGGGSCHLGTVTTEPIGLTQGLTLLLLAAGSFVLVILIKRR